MNTLIKYLFIVYHAVFVSSVATCRFQPTCSQYFLDSVEKHGTIRGIVHTIKRVLSCHPLSRRPIIDPA